MKPWIDVIEETESFLRTQVADEKFEVQRSLAVLLVHKALELKDISVLDEAEIWFIKAALRGDSFDQKYLESIWPDEKIRHMNCIKKKSF